MWPARDCVGRHPAFAAWREYDFGLAAGTAIAWTLAGMNGQTMVWESS